MGRRSGRSVMVIGIAAAIAAIIAWLLCTGRDTEPRSNAPGASAPEIHETPPPAAGAVIAATEGVTPGPLRLPAPVVAGSPPDAPSGSGAPALPRPEDGQDGPAWRKARLAFGVRELGRMGPYVKVGLDAAREDMAFCFRHGGRTAADASAAEGDAAPPQAQPTVLQLYLEAREGALDIVDARTDTVGSASREVVECCREVLRGREIRAFNAVPGQRYRLKFRLD